MNEQITKLIEQSITGTSKKWLSLDDANTLSKLIIEECLDIVSAGGELCSRPKLVEKIKEHFGVEE